MSSLRNYKNLYGQRNLTHFFPRFLFSEFFYRFAKLITRSKIRKHARIITFTYDLVAVCMAWILAYGLVSKTFIDFSIAYEREFVNDTSLIISYWKIIANLIWILPLQIFLFRIYGLYRSFWRFSSIQDLKKIIVVTGLGGTLIWILLQTNLTFLSGSIHFGPIPHLFPNYLIVMLYMGFLIVFLSSARLFMRVAKDSTRIYRDYKRVIIVGAGNAGESLVRDLLRDNNLLYRPVGFVDDDLKKLGREIHSIRVIGTIVELPKLISDHKIDLVLIAMPSASSASMRSVVDICEKTNVRCYTLPGIKDLANGHISINVLRNISLEDLLGRYPVSCQLNSIETFLKGKTILITGGGGSIGSELCRQLLALNCITQLIIIDNNEYNLYAIDLELNRSFPCQFKSVLLSITDRTGLRKVLNEYQPHIVFHAAAYKHVPLLENQPRIAIYNNIVGTKILAEESADIGVETFILISTDKAVNPTNIMGATKRAAEYFCQNLNYHTEKTQFITVRFGNVLDSAGSVIPLFRKQIETGGPVTVTHPDVTRFFMTIPEASQLILQAAFLGQGGEIFVLDMGDPIKIRYLAEQMIKLAGKTVEQDIKIKYVGLRPGEKLFEECFYSNESLQTTTHTKILIAQSQRRNFDEIQNICNRIYLACKSQNVNNQDLINLLQLLVPEYKNQMLKQPTLDNNQVFLSAKLIPSLL